MRLAKALKGHVMLLFDENTNNGSWSSCISHAIYDCRVPSIHTSNWANLWAFPIKPGRVPVPDSVRARERVRAEGVCKSAASSPRRCRQPGEQRVTQSFVDVMLASLWPRNEVDDVSSQVCKVLPPSGFPPSSRCTCDDQISTVPARTRPLRGVLLAPL
jgi:hypothetical protein